MKSSVSKVWPTRRRPPDAAKPGRSSASVDTSTPLDVAVGSTSPSLSIEAMTASSLVVASPVGAATVAAAVIATVGGAAVGVSGDGLGEATGTGVAGWLGVTDATERDGVAGAGPTGVIWTHAATNVAINTTTGNRRTDIGSSRIRL